MDSAGKLIVRAQLFFSDREGQAVCSPNATVRNLPLPPPPHDRPRGDRFRGVPPLLVFYAQRLSGDWKLCLDISLRSPGLDEFEIKIDGNLEEGTHGFAFSHEKLFTTVARQAEFERGTC